MRGTWKDQCERYWFHFKSIYYFLHLHRQFFKNFSKSVNELDVRERYIDEKFLTILVKLMKFEKCDIVRLRVSNTFLTQRDRNSQNIDSGLRSIVHSLISLVSVTFRQYTKYKWKYRKVIHMKGLSTLHTD